MGQLRAQENNVDNDGNHKIWFVKSKNFINDNLISIDLLYSCDYLFS